MNYTSIELKVKSVKWGLVIPCGWFVMLIGAAIILPPTNSSLIAIPILVLMLLWFLLSVVALSMYFYRAWCKVALVPNKATYVAWMSIETAFVLLIVGGVICFFLLPRS